MKHGFIKTVAATNELCLANPFKNAEVISDIVLDQAAKGAKVIVFPELCITGYTCQDLFLQDILLNNARNALGLIINETSKTDAIVFVGLPWIDEGKLYNVAAAFKSGKLLGLIPKTALPNHGEFYEKRHFEPAPLETKTVKVDLGTSGAQFVPFGTNILFSCESVPDLVIAVELCEDVWTPNPPSISHALAGATLIVNCSASDEATGKAQYRRELISGQSARLLCAYVYANASGGESSQDLVFGGHNIIAEYGHILAESKRFKNEVISSEIDVKRLAFERRHMTTFKPCPAKDYAKDYVKVSFDLKIEKTHITRYVDPLPFVPSSVDERFLRCKEIISIQASGLARRLKAASSKHLAVVGVSGGLDSTLALLVTAKAFDICSYDRKGILGVTMPGFGTTSRTKENARKLVESSGATLKEIDISSAVNQHFDDINQDPNSHDVTYENAQARERTQVLMDLANKHGGIVVGTGDMSELALGWCTYNGDHMSMYGVNSGVPKTLVRHLVSYFADTCSDSDLAGTLVDVLKTPVSPELLPPDGDDISQATEEIVGPYELHDFFLYQVLRFGFEPIKVFRLAKIAFTGKYDPDEIQRWLIVFYERFFSQQFKRSCLPDGPRVGSVALSPRGDLRMPSDACGDLWTCQARNLPKWDEQV